MKPVIEQPFGFLRYVSSRVIEAVCSVCGYDEKEVSLSTSLNHDLRIQGDDVNDVLAELYYRDNILLHGLNFSDYFFTEGELPNQMIGNLVLMPFELFAYVIQKIGAPREKPISLFGDAKSKPSLTIADIVTSAIEGHFVPRSERRFVLQ